MADTATPAEEPDAAAHCRLIHRLFHVVGTPIFRKSESDLIPVMAISFGEREAVLPLDSLQREFSIDPGSPDGLMLGQIAAALDFVSALRIGDPLPSEILTGAASWESDPQHRDIAATRLRLQLVDWLNTGAGAHRAAMDVGSLLLVADDPQLRRQVQQALTRAAETLGVESPLDIVERLAQLSDELAYIEALRDRLLRRVREMSGKVENLARGFRGGATQVETLGQVRRLSSVALRRIGTRFEELDRRTGDVITALRNVAGHQVFIRQQRDWLYRSQRAWEPILTEWDAASGLDEGTLGLLGRTYRFLAPRFMPVKEWTTALSSGRQDQVNRSARMIW
jgi:hypothetical protein